MSGTWALVPAKAPGRAKTRLAPVLNADESAELSAHMLLDVLDALEAATAVDHIAVLTDADSVAALARGRGHEVLHDPADSEINSALNAAARELAARGATTVLIIPGDIPTLRATDLDALLARHPGGLSLCPAIRDGGTNVLIASPPDAIEFCFGADSAALHLAAAERAGITAARLCLPAFFRDIDVPDDLAWLSHQDHPGHAATFLRHSGISARLQRGRSAGHNA